MGRGIRKKKAIGENQYTIPYNNQETDETHLSNDQKAYGIDKKYSDENNTSSEQKDKNSLKRVIHNKQPKSTVQKIAEQSKVGLSTVQRAEKFADEVDKVAQNVGINP